MAVTELPDAPGHGRGIHWVGTTDPGAVGPLEVWFDPSGAGTFKVRDLANAAWLTVGGAGAPFVYADSVIYADCSVPGAIPGAGYFMPAFNTYYDPTSSLIAGAAVTALLAALGLTVDVANQVFTVTRAGVLSLRWWATSTTPANNASMGPKSPSYWDDRGINMDKLDALGGEIVACNVGDTFSFYVMGTVGQTPYNDATVAIARLI
jgi:hypothetical protein